MKEIWGQLKDGASREDQSDEGDGDNQQHLNINNGATAHR